MGRGRGRKGSCARANKFIRSPVGGTGYDLEGREGRRGGRWERANSLLGPQELEERATARHRNLSQPSQLSTLQLPPRVSLPLPQPAA